MVLQTTAMHANDYTLPPPPPGRTLEPSLSSCTGCCGSSFPEARALPISLPGGGPRGHYHENHPRTRTSNNWKRYGGWPAARCHRTQSGLALNTHLLLLLLVLLLDTLVPFRMLVLLFSFFCCLCLDSNRIIFRIMLHCLLPRLSLFLLLLPAPRPQRSSSSSSSSNRPLFLNFYLSFFSSSQTTTTPTKELCRLHRRQYLPPIPTQRWLLLILRRPKRTISTFSPRWSPLRQKKPWWSLPQRKSL